MGGSQVLSGYFLGRSFIAPHLVKPLTHFAENLTGEKEGGETPSLHDLSFFCSLQMAMAEAGYKPWANGLFQSPCGKQLLSLQELQSHLPGFLSLLSYSTWLLPCDFTCRHRRKPMLGVMLSQLHTLCRTVGLGHRPPLFWPSSTVSCQTRLLGVEVGKQVPIEG